MKNEYKVCYRCNDGTVLFFIHESDRRLVNNYKTHGPNLNTNPLLNEVWAKIMEKRNNPESKCNKEHGGYDRLVKIKNMKTGNVQYYDCI